MRTTRLPSVLVILLSPAVAVAQNGFDPPTAERAAPNVLLLMDSTRTTLINGATCTGTCHVEDTGNSGHHDSSIYQNGETRLQLGRRVLTGGWGWNTAGTGPSGSADASVRRDGVMDQYFVRWGLLFYDGLGTRLALNPTLDNALAQQRVIDFGQPGFGEGFSAPPINPALNSYLPHYRTTRCCGNGQQGGLGADGNDESSPVYDEATDAGGRMTRALQYVRDYIDSTGPVAQWAPGPLALAAYGTPSATPVGNFFRGDVSNVLRSAPPDGCRRNFVIHLTDGHGEGNYGGETRGQAAADIHNMVRNDGTPLPAHLANQLFTIHFGAQNKAEADTVADCGYDGVCGNGPLAFSGAPGGVINDLTPMYAAFTAIFQLVLSGNYLASPPTITRSGDRVISSRFVIQNCQSALPTQCNIGRIGDLRMEEVLYPTATSLGVTDDVINFSEVLRNTSWLSRNLFTSINAIAGNNRCGRAASCPVATRAEWTSIEDNTFPGNNPPTLPATGTDGAFLRGEPSSRFSNGVMRSDTSNGLTAALSGRNPYKLMDIANSQPVVVGAPSGIGEDIERWEAFLDMGLGRTMQLLGLGSTGWRQKRGGYPSTGMTVATRDQVVYIGGNDGLLHAFLSGRAAGTPAAGRTANYPVAGGDLCAVDTGEFPAQGNPAGCLGLELWAYSPQLVQSQWPSIRSGHYFMVDGTPVVSDVLFTKRTSNPGGVCTPGLGLHNCGSRWEYRTVLLQCLGSGGPGCFALDVTNPYRPEMLWEREMTVPGVTRGTSTSRPQIVRVRRVVGGVVIPYYVGIMGGGLGESAGGVRRGSVIAMGLEDGDWYASTGANVATADFSGSPTCLDADGDSYTDTCYIATTDAKIYKVRIGNLNPGNLGTSAAITMELFFDGRQRLLAVGRTAAEASAARVYSRVVATFDRNRDVRLYFATGNFEDVQNATEQNFFFEVSDTAPEGGLVAWSNALNNTRAGGAVCNAGPNAGVLAFPLGQKVIFDPLISNGSVVFTSYRPDPNPCRVGNGYLYGISVDTCGNGIDSNDVDTNPDNGAIGGTVTQFTNALPMAPVINERTGGISVALQLESGTDSILANQGFTRRLPAPPVSKLWWRVMR
jgi:hypothetical protein